MNLERFFCVVFFGDYFADFKEIFNCILLIVNIFSYNNICLIIDSVAIGRRRYLHKTWIQYIYACVLISLLLISPRVFFCVVFF